MWIIRKLDTKMFLNWRGYLLGTGLVGIINLLKYLAAPTVVPADKAILYMLAILPTAVFWGLGPSILVSVLSVLAYDYFFLGPQSSLGNIQDAPLLLVFLAVGIITSYLASNLRRKIESERSLTEKLIIAQEEERKRIAGELHDEAAPNLAYLGLELDSISKAAQSLPEDIVLRLKAVREKMNVVQQEVRRFSHELHPAILENLGLEAALETLSAEMNSRGQIKVQFDVTGRERKLPDQSSINLYRIAQEALNNAWKHSKATIVSVKLEYITNGIKLLINDNGTGFDILSKRGTKGGLGLLSMKERANIIGAKLNIESVSGKGTVVTVEIHQS